MKGQRIYHLAFAVFLVSLASFLFFRSGSGWRWSDWATGDAQTLLTLEHWKNNGRIYNKFLFIPQGYAKVITMLDEPALRHHAHGISPGPLRRVGARLWYTHYPAGYIVPYSLFFDPKTENVFFLRSISLVFSLSGIVLFYLVLARIANPAVAFVSAFIYCLYPFFLNFADSLANQPLDDFLRFAFMLLVVLSTRAVSFKARRISLCLAWITEFLLSLASFDSVFFVYFWLIGWDFVERRGWRWRTYLIFALAPLGAHLLQFLQNIWYLGLPVALQDITDTFLERSWPHQMPVSGVFYVPVGIFTMLFGKLCRPLDMPFWLLVLYLVYRRINAKPEEIILPSLRLLLVLLFCGLAYAFVLPCVAGMSYQGRQIAPFLALLVSSVTWSFFKELPHPFRSKATAAYIVVSGLCLAAFWLNFAFVNRSPAYPADRLKMHRDIDLATRIKPIPAQNDRVIFSVNGFNTFLNPRYEKGYPQINPLIEYYVGLRPVLCFDRPELLAVDLAYMIRHGKYRFSPLLVSQNVEDIEKALFILSREALVAEKPEKIYYISGRYVMVLENSIRWPDSSGP